MSKQFNATIEMELVNNSSNDHLINHSKLNSLHVKDQHPIPAIIGLSKELSDIDGRIEDMKDYIEEIAASIEPVVGTNRLTNVAALKASLDLKDGSYVETAGYYTPGDKGGAFYQIERVSYPWSIALASGLYANINQPSQVNYRQFGAYLDGVRDDGPALLLCHAYANAQFHTDAKRQSRYYTCTIKNDTGIIFKKNKDPLFCYGDVDLSGSTLLLTDDNATWYGLYMWGDVNSMYFDYELTDEVKASFEKDTYVVTFASNDALPTNTVLRIEEDPYSVRDDAGYLYSVGRRELLIHDMDGILSSPFADDWFDAGGEEINCKVTNLETGVISNMKAYSKLKASYTYIPNKQGTFTGCTVLLNTSADAYSSVLTVYRHNALVKDFIFKPAPDSLHNRKYKNSMIYIRDSYRVTVRNIQGFNAAGKQQGAVKATSGYMIRLTNCSDVTLEDCRLQGYWGATAMDSVKNIRVLRCHINRFDTHDYCYNIYAEHCTFYHHSLQIGYGRGSATFTNCDFYYNDVPLNSYPEAYAIALNLTYGRIFEGVITIENCTIRCKDVPNNEYSLVEMYFRANATSIVKHFNFPELRFKNIHIMSHNENINLHYVKIGGKRYGRTSVEMPKHIYGETVDNTVRWEYVGRGFNWGEDTGRPLDVIVGDVLKVSDTVKSPDGTTRFYSTRYFTCTKAGLMVYDNKPNNVAESVTVGTAQFQRWHNPEWRSKKAYALGERCLVSNSNFYEPYIYTCIKAGISEGYYPTHTAGTVLEGPNDAVSEPDQCWWEYYCKDHEMVENFQQATRFPKGTVLNAEGRLYEVITPILTTVYPPFETGWLQESLYGGGILKYIGNEWEPKKWYALGSYCKAGTNIYILRKHSGITSGVQPTRGNKYCVDGDITWEYLNKNAVSSFGVSGTTPWAANTEYEPLSIVTHERRIYEVQDTLTSSSSAPDLPAGTSGMDGNTPVLSYGTFENIWRVQGASYKVGDIVFDNTFVIICVKAGATNPNSKWGPLESAAWPWDGLYIDGDCHWRKLTETKANGFWRNSNRHYAVGSILLVSKANNHNEVLQVRPQTSGTTPPTSTGSTSFLNGTMTLMYRGMDSEWAPDTRYNEGEVIQAGALSYRCAFDGRLRLPHRSLFEGITTNVKNVNAFHFLSGVDVPVSSQPHNWTVVMRDCENVTKDISGLPSDRYFFGSTTNINPTFKKS